MKGGRLQLRTVFEYYIISSPFDFFDNLNIFVVDVHQGLAKL